MHEAKSARIDPIDFTFEGPLDEEKKKRQQKVICKCPGENCQGFILGRSYSCVVCETKICKDCHITLSSPSSDHECKPEDVETARFISRSTQPCPKCKTLIHKIDGCDQMWCTICHTAFSYRTGLEEKGVVHNPHFYEWQRIRNNGEAPRVPGDRPECQEVQAFHIADFFVFGDKSSYFFLNLHRFLYHVKATRADFQEDDGEDNDEAKLELFREELLDNEITDDEFREKIYRFHKIQEKRKDIRDVFQLFEQGSKDVFQNMYQFQLQNCIDKRTRELMPLPGQYVNERKAEFDQLINFVNICFQDVGNKYKNKAYKIFVIDEGEIVIRKA